MSVGSTTRTEPAAGGDLLAPVSSQPHWSRSIISLAVGFLCAAIVIEGTARLAFRSQSLLHKIGGNAESLNRLRWIDGHRRPRTILLAFDQFDSVRGWALIPNLRNMSVFNGKFLNSNSRGIRGAVEYSESPPLGKKRILVLGDSFTFGEEVSDDQTYAHYLETLLPDTEVLNFGVHGYGHDQMLLYFKQEGVRYHPDVVLVGFMWLDMDRNVPAFTFYAKPKYELRNGKLVLTHVPVPPPQEVLREEVFRLKSLDLFQIAWRKFKVLTRLEQQEAHTITAAILDEIVAVCHQNGATPMFVYMPTGQEIADPDPSAHVNEQFLTQYCESRHALCLFLRPAFLAAHQREADAGVNVSAEMHWKPYQHMIAARAIQQFLIAKGLVPAPAQPGD